MCKRFFVIILLLNLFLSKKNLLYAQLTHQKTQFSHQDTLRGSLSALRSCFDVKFYDLNIEVNFEQRSIEGWCNIDFILLEPTQQIQIDLFANMLIDSIRYNGQPLAFIRDGNATMVNFPTFLYPKQAINIQVFYRGSPVIAKNAPWDGGFVWKKDKNNQDWLSVACQGTGASLWWPNKDHLSDEPDSMRIAVTVPAHLSAICNGNLRTITPVSSTQKRFEWWVSYPINNYNVTLNVGDYAHWQEPFYSVSGDTIALDFYPLRQNLPKAREHFKQTFEIIKCLEATCGAYPFPKDGFALVETPYLGMEHQGAVAYGNNYQKGYSGVDLWGLGLPEDFIILHETGHEWWGNNVGCSDIADMWIHEAFCTYAEGLYMECKYGYSLAMDYLNAQKKSISNDSPILGVYGVNEEGNGDMYVKGALFLNTLRHIINNDEQWDALIKGIQTEFRLQQIDYKTLLEYFNRKTGIDLSKIFKQYIEYPLPPRLEKRFVNKYEVQVRWHSEVNGFSMPLLYNTSDNEQWKRVEVGTEWKTIVLDKESAKNINFAERLLYFLYH